MDSVSRRIHDMISLDAFLFHGVPEGRHRDRMLQRRQRQRAAQKPTGEILGILTFNPETGEMSYEKLV